MLLAYRRDSVPVRIVGLNPAPADVALFRRLLTPAPTVVAAPAPGAVATGTRTPFPWLLVLCVLLACSAVAAVLAWSPRLEWGHR